jgi:hypothetical protein
MEKAVYELSHESETHLDTNKIPYVKVPHLEETVGRPKLMK